MKFRGEFYFLSNMYPATVRMKCRGETLEFTCAEAAFQACKAPGHEKEFVGLDGYEAKRAGRRVPLRADWEQVKLKAMCIVVKAKFGQNPILMDRLCKTGNLPLVEENTWGDRFWGVCGGVGENYLGRVLMSVRDSQAGRGTAHKEVHHAG